MAWSAPAHCSAGGELFDRGGGPAEVAEFGDARRLLLGHRSHRQLGHADPDAAGLLGELVAGVQDRARVDPAAGGPPRWRVVDGDLAVQMTAAVAPVLVV